jgi:hypothetical protein
VAAEKRLAVKAATSFEKPACLVGPPAMFYTRHLLLKDDNLIKILSISTLSISTLSITIKGT